VARPGLAAARSIEILQAHHAGALHTPFSMSDISARPPTRLTRTDFNRPTLVVARDLLGTYLVRRVDGVEIAGMISEVEAYKGPRDRAAHTWGGRRTARVLPLYGDGGTVYVYLVYGIHWLLNFSTAAHEVPEGVLIRGVLTKTSSGVRRMHGPGLVTRYLRIDGTLSGADATTSDALWIENRGVRIRAAAVHRGPRVGVDYAGPYWAARPWRFWIAAEMAPTARHYSERRQRP
jgi:DNA-3-methyladenine glycosylase